MVRSDKQTAVKVNRGLAVALIDGIAAGAREMASGGVPFDVAHRVLLHPPLRRPTDWR